MVPKPAFRLVYAPQVKQHLAAIDRKYHTLIRRNVEARLQFEPELQTRNRKPLRRPVDPSGTGGMGAEWEIRFGPDSRFRVFYDVDRDEGAVYILAVGEKARNRLYIGGEEIQL